MDVTRVAAVAFKFNLREVGTICKGMDQRLERVINLSLYDAGFDVVHAPMDWDAYIVMHNEAVEAENTKDVEALQKETLQEIEANKTTAGSRQLLGLDDAPGDEVWEKSNWYDESRIAEEEEEVAGWEEEEEDGYQQRQLHKNCKNKCCDLCKCGMPQKCYCAEYENRRRGLLRDGNSIMVRLHKDHEVKLLEKFAAKHAITYLKHWNFHIHCLADPYVVEVKIKANLP